VSEQLLLLCRWPAIGHAKTRLIPHLGPAGAADLSRRLTEHTVDVARRWRAAGPGRCVRVVGTGESPARFAAWLGPDLAPLPQANGDLGERMQGALEHALADGATTAVIVGIDCPTSDASNLARAFRYLADSDLVLGPATDGGYYLLGLRAIHPELFADVPWGTDAVFACTRAVAADLGLKTALLPVLDDVDEANDVPAAEAILAAESSRREER